MNDALRTNIVFYGSRADAGDLTRENAALGLVEAACGRLSLAQARQAVDTWQGYLQRPAVDPGARRAFLSRLFTRRTTNPKETSNR
ncbi:MAG: hypothetical protein ACM3S1_13580 [Hyphomicrobiales bacterium]